MAILKPRIAKITKSVIKSKAPITPSSSEIMAKKESLPKTRFGDAYDPAHVEQINKLSKANLA